jgi:hypothetical protein
MPKFQLFIQDQEGNNNYEKDFLSREIAMSELGYIRSAGGYWTGDTFVPWHRIDFARVKSKPEKKDA